MSHPDRGAAMPAPIRSCVAATAATALATLLGSALLAAPASADRTFHTTRYELIPVAGAPLRSGSVIDIHAEGPRIYAQERYHLSGALPSTEYQVVLRIYGDTDCGAKSFIAALPTATLSTNKAGNGNGAVTFRPADAAELAAAQDEYGLVWQVITDDAVAYTTGCQVVALD
jgi:hypothetical protein